MKKTIALIIVLILLAVPVVSFGELTPEEKALVKTTVKNINIKIDKVQDNLRDELKEECIAPHDDVVKKVEELVKRIEDLEKKHE